MVVNATGEVRPKVAMATAKANSKLLPEAVYASGWFGLRSKSAG